MITVTNAGFAFGQKILFFDVNLNLNTNTSYALVGANGSGKSTFFKLINGEEELSEGTITVPTDATVGWLKQNLHEYENTPIRDVVLQGKQELWHAFQEKDALLASETWDDSVGFRLGALEEIIAHYNGYQVHVEIEAILNGLGIISSYHEQPLNVLSLGYKLRVLLAQILFQRPSILLLDEPTNHLDILSIQWLEQFLKNSFAGLVVFISHDKEFINHLADAILDIDYGEIRKYSGNYDLFLTEKQLVQEQKIAEKKNAEEKIAHMQKFVDRFRAIASKAAQARARMKMIEKVEIPDLLNTSRIAPHFNFVPKRPSGKQVCKVQLLSKAYNNNVLFNKFNIEIQRHDKLSIMGVNGRGKSTLIKMLVGDMKSDSGDIQWGSEMRIGYFSQDHRDLLNHSISTLNWLSEMAPTSNEQTVRKALGQMLFTKDDVDKDILLLSGGESARLLLAKIILEAPNVLILDEPTNHMDLETIESLAEALIHYTGTVILVSHNRYLIERISTRILYLDQNGGATDYKGKYSDFVADGYLAN